ncbi:hypothetical protein BDQ17DRAFT_1392046 [Cyathus striatus]|nr:hypothetical protein BDQ17DRAFT_1392046 [Cyathus striatus]
MVVVDGIVMGPAHCAIENCTQDLVNARQGVFCAMHEVLHKNLCRVNGCNKNLHQQKWQSHLTRFGRQSLLGVQRILRRTQEERLPWLPQINRQVQAHDIMSSREEKKKKDYFSPSRFYCVETICAPCGVVLAWAKFDKSESVDQIFEFLEKVFPTEDVRPSYVCIDKACVLLKSAATNGKWMEWRHTTQFVVDSYHYINHRVTDYICHKWCNPAPLNGSAPNLVVVEHDVNGVPHYKHAFNTQACEQLNAWIGGFQTMLNRMTLSNFNWTMHTLLFLHTQRVIKKQHMREQVLEEDNNEEIGIDIERDD